jgi:hypothetical protein
VHYVLPLAQEVNGGMSGITQTIAKTLLALPEHNMGVTFTHIYTRQQNDVHASK